jgi:hypothetical protein
MEIPLSVRAELVEAPFFSFDIAKGRAALRQAQGERNLRRH